MNAPHFVIYLSVIVISCLPLSTWAQSAGPASASAGESLTRFWIGAGVGLGELIEGEDDPNDEGGGALAGALYGSYQFGPNLLSARTAFSGELFGDNFADYGILYGRATTGRLGHASVSAGVAVVSGSYSDDRLILDPDGDEPERVLTVGLPVEVQLMWRPLPFFGLGLYGFANLNPEASFVGATLSAQLGLMRR